MHSASGTTEPGDVGPTRGRFVLSGEIVQDRFHLGPERLVCQIASTGLGDYNDLPGPKQLIPLQAYDLTQPTFNPVPYYSIPDFSAYRKAEPHFSIRSEVGHHGQMSSAVSPALSEHATKLDAPEDSLIFLERESHRRGVTASWW
jgi:hypothetical protein